MQIVTIVGLAAPPAPVGLDENIGSCGPDPMIIRWDMTQKTWHTDVDKVGRYSIRKGGVLSQAKGLWHAFLNGQPLAECQDKDLDVVKRKVERRIREAARIAGAPVYEGFHKNKVGNSFQVFGSGTNWFWWQREPENDPLSRSQGPYPTGEAAYKAAMANEPD